MTVPPDNPEVGFDYAGAKYRMVFDMRAIAFFEREAGVSMVTALAELEEARDRAEPPKISTMAFLMQAGLRRHHPEVTPERALRMAADPDVQAALGTGVRGALPDAPDDAPSAEGNGASPLKGGTGTKRSKGRSKRA